jgi:hypothetical protein
LVTRKLSGVCIDWYMMDGTTGVASIVCFDDVPNPASSTEPVSSRSSVPLLHATLHTLSACAFA